MRIVFFGTPYFAVPTLEHLLRSKHDVAGVVTQPDRARGRGHHVAAPPVKHTAMKHQLPVLQPQRISDPSFFEAARDWRPDLGVVAAYGKILPQALLDLPRLGMINVHASLLPKYRGAAPIQRAVMAGEQETGITIIRLVQALDAGPMLAKLIRPIATDETSEEVEEQLAFLGAALLVSVVDDLAAGRAIETPQDPAEATYAPRLTKEEGLIDWGLPAAVIHNRIRGLQPWPHAFTFLEGQRLILLKSRPEPDGSIESGQSDFQPGEVLLSTGEQLLVSCGGRSALSVLEIQPEGRRALNVRAFLAGHHVRSGQRFTSMPNPGSRLSNPDSRIPNPE